MKEDEKGMIDGLYVGHDAFQLFSLTSGRSRFNSHYLG